MPVRVKVQLTICETCAYLIQYGVEEGNEEQERASDTMFGRFGDDCAHIVVGEVNEGGGPTADVFSDCDTCREGFANDTYSAVILSNE